MSAVADAESVTHHGLNLPEGPTMLRLSCFYVFALIGSATCCRAAEQIPPEGLDVSVRVEFGEDLGKNIGSFWEARDSDGRVIAGAGVASLWNTESRSDRRILQFYLSSSVSGSTPTFEPVPKPHDGTSIYLSSFHGDVLARPRGTAEDNRLLRRDEAAGRWRPAPTESIARTSVADGTLAALPNEIRFNAATLVAVDGQDGRVGEVYYGQGRLVYRLLPGTSKSAVNRLIATQWRPGEPLQSVDPKIVPLGTPGEFVYAFGQFADKLLAATNTGGVYLLDETGWRTLRPPNVRVSHQIYCSALFADRLLLGHYPTGELWDFSGRELQLLKGQPPVMPSVSTHAREAQTLGIYGGQLYAGVWPWGELWRFDGKRWEFVRRMFTQPAPTSATVHPYEKETAAVDPVYNLWGQRVTSMVAHGDALWISTSSKGGTPIDARFKFLGPTAAEEYGAVWRMRVPGNLAVRFEWKSTPSLFRFRADRRLMEVWQDGSLLGRTALPADASALHPAGTTLGQGVFGPTSLRLARP